MADPISAAIAAFSAAAASVTAAATTALVGAGLSTAVATAVVSAGTQFVISAAAGATMSALSPKPKVNATASQLQTKVGAVTPRAIIMGRTAVAGTLLTPTPLKSGKDDRFASNFYALSHAGPSGVVESIIWGDDVVTFDGSGNAIGKYNDNMWLFQRNGDWNQTAISYSGHPVLGSSTPSAWDSTKRARGCLTVALVVRYAAKVLGGNMQTPIFVVDANAVALTDPRTGSPATTQAQRRNPAVWAYSWRLGWFQNSKRVIGMGQASGELHAAGYAYAANVADANGWTISGEATTADDRYAVESAMLLAAASVPVERNGLQSVVTSALRSSVGTITSNDLRADPKWRYSTQQSSRPTAIQTRYRSETNRWQMVEGAEVTDASWLTQDAGREKRVTVEYAYAGGGSAHVGHLAALDASNAREPLIFSLQCKQQARYAGFVGDAVTVSLPEIGLSSTKMVIVSRVVNADGTVDYELLVETDAKYAFAAGKTSAAPSFTLQPGFDIFSVPQPGAAEWASVAAQITSGATSLPIVRVTGSAADYSFASGVVFKIRLNSGGSPWLVSEDAPPDVTQHEFRGLTNATSYIVGVAYRGVTGVEGPVRELAAVTTGDLVSGTAATITPQAANLVPGSGPIYRPDRPAIAWMGEPENVRWTVVETGNVGLGVARWNYNINPSIASDPLMSPLIAIEGGAVISAQAQLFRLGTWTTGDIGAAIHVYDASEVQIGSPIMIGWASAGVPVAGYTGCFAVKAENITLPGGAAFIRAVYDVVSATGSGSGGANRVKINRGSTCTVYSEEATNNWTFGSEIGRDFRLPDGNLAPVERVDNIFSPRTDGVTAITVQQDFAGNALPGQLDRTFQIRRFNGTTDVTSTTTFSVTMTGGTATITTGGLLQITSTVGGRITVTTVRDGLTIPHIIEVTAINAALPATGGGGARNAVDTTIDPTSSGSLVTCGGPITVRAGSAGQIIFGASLAYTTSSTSNSTAGARIRYRVGAGAWTWAAAEVTGSVANSGFAYEQGDIDAGAAVTGLVNGTDYECELQCRRATGSGTLYFYGSFAAEAS